MKTKVFLNNEHLYICTFYYSHNMKYPPSILPSSTTFSFWPASFLKLSSSCFDIFRCCQVLLQQFYNTPWLVK